jgi:hypothetical protein
VGWSVLSWTGSWTGWSMQTSLPPVWRRRAGRPSRPGSRWKKTTVYNNRLQKIKYWKNSNWNVGRKKFRTIFQLTSKWHIFYLGTLQKSFTESILFFLEKFFFICRQEREGTPPSPAGTGRGTREATMRPTNDLIRLSLYESIDSKHFRVT